MNEQFTKELLNQARKDNVIMSFKEYSDGFGLVYEMWVFTKNNKKTYVFKMTKEEWNRMKFLMDIVDEERMERK